MKHLDVPFEQLKISKFNMRYHEPPPDISHILPSIKAKGILVPLLIRPEDGRYGVVYGRSRWFSAKDIVRESGSIKPLPCILMEDGDDTDAIEASLIENMARRNPDPMTEHETFVQLIKAGRSIDGIGLTFGMTQSQVKQRLALGNLLPKIRDAYRAEEIDDETVCHLTMASKGQQKEWLKLWAENDAPFGSQVKQWLCGGQAISTKVALFPLEDYKGHTIADLFGEDSYFQDTGLFWELQNAAIAAKADALREAGWEGVHVLEIGERFNSWDFEKTPKKKGGEVYIAISPRGEVEIHDGWLGKRQARRAAKQGEAAKDGKPAMSGTAHPAITRTLENYLELHRHALVRLALIGNPNVALRLMVAHAAASSGNWQVKSDPQRSRSDEVKKSIASAPAQAAFKTERDAVAALIALPDQKDEHRPHSGGNDETTLLFTRLLALSEADVLRVAALVMADTLAVGSASVEAAGTHLTVDARALWQPDEAFFELVRDRTSVNAVLAEIGGPAIAKANVAEKAKTQKKIIRDFLTGTNGRQKVEGWLPGWMAFPFRQLGERSRPAKVKVEAKVEAKREIEPERIAAE